MRPQVIEDYEPPSESGDDSAQQLVLSEGELVSTTLGYCLQSIVHVCQLVFCMGRWPSRRIMARMGGMEGTGWQIRYVHDPPANLRQHTVSTWQLLSSSAPFVWWFSESLCLGVAGPHPGLVFLALR